MFIVGLNHRGAHWGPLSHLLLLVLLLVLLVRPGAAAAVGAANAGGVLTFAVQEEAPNGTKVGGPVGAAFLASRQASDVHRSAAVRDRLVYTLTTSTAHTLHLALDPRSSQLSVAGRIDREALCPGAAVGACLLPFQLLASVPGQTAASAVINAQLDVSDRNDCGPEFPGDSTDVEVEVLESAPVGTTSIPLPMARDPDSPPNAAIQYSTEPRLPPQFELTTTSTTDPTAGVRVTTPVLRLKSKLDRETTASYNFVLVASGTKENNIPVSATVNVTVRVLDVNEHSPEFTQRLYNVSISEDLLPGTVVVRVEATDRDADANGRVLYSLGPGAVDLFSILTDGTLILMRELDYERARVHRVAVHARDEAGHPTTAEAVVLVHVLDSNDNPPVIAFDNGAIEVGEDGEAVVRVVEGPESRDRQLAIVSVSDRDAGPNGQFTCALANAHVPGALFELVPFGSGGQSGPAAYYQLKVAPNVELDREAPAVRNGALQLTVTCEDRGVPHPLNAQRRLTVQLDDLNDNAPRFSSPLIRATIGENNAPGAQVVQVSATDADSGLNGTVRYSIPDERAAFYFAVDARDGRLTAVRAFDREERESYEFFVLAVDSAEQLAARRTATAVLLVQVSDENDNEPYFEPSSLTWDKPEAPAQRQFVGRVQAIDADLKPARDGALTSVAVQQLRDQLLRAEQQQRPAGSAASGSGSAQANAIIGSAEAAERPQLSFRLGLEMGDEARDASGRPVLSVTPSGELFTAGELDREHRAFYLIPIIVEDNGHPNSRSASGIVRLNVKDVNDNLPVFTFPTASNMTIPVYYQLTSGAVIGQLTARDADETASIRFSLGDISENNRRSTMDLVAVDDKTGELKLTRSLSAADIDRRISLEVRVADVPPGGAADMKQRTTKGTLIIVIVRLGPYGHGGTRFGQARSPLDSLSKSPRGPGSGSGADAAAGSSIASSSSSAGAPTVLHVLIAFLLCLVLMALVGFVLVLVLRRRAEFRAMRRKQEAQTKPTAPTPLTVNGGAPTPDLMEERTLEMREAQLSAEKLSLLEAAPPFIEAPNTFENPRSHQYSSRHRHERDADGNRRGSRSERRAHRRRESPVAGKREDEDSEVMRTLAARGEDPRAYTQAEGLHTESASGTEPMQPMGMAIGSPRLYEDCTDLSLGRESSYNNNNGSGGCVVPYAGEPTATLMRSSQTFLPYCIFSPAAMGCQQMQMQMPMPVPAASVAPFHTLAPGAQLQQLANGGGAAQFPLTLFPNLQGAADAAATGPAALYSTLHAQTSPQATINPYSVQYMLQPQLAQTQQQPVAASSFQKRSAFTPPSRHRAEPLQLAESAALGFQPIDAAPVVPQQQTLPSGRQTAVQLYSGGSGPQVTTASYGLSGRQSEGRYPTAGAKSYALVKGEFV